MSLTQAPGVGTLARLLKYGSMALLAVINLLFVAALISEQHTSSIKAPKSHPVGFEDKPNEREALLIETIQKLQQSVDVSEDFRLMQPIRILRKMDKVMALSNGKKDFDPFAVFGIPKSSFCKLAALKYNVAHTNPNNKNILFDPPLTTPIGAKGIVFTTYFNSRVDPLRCYKHPKGRMPVDDWDYIEHWYLSVRRLGLHGVIFHESLSENFVRLLTTDKITFQRVQLAHHNWSLCDERWAVYSRWLESPASDGVEYVLQTDISDTVIAEDPFLLFESGLAVDHVPGYDAGLARGGHEPQQGQPDIPDLWVNVQKGTDWVQENYVECYGVNNTSLLPGGDFGLVYNAGVVGGRREAFLELAYSLSDEFKMMYSHAERPIWNCDMSALHRTLVGESFLKRWRVFAGGHPFCAGGVKCWGHGQCDYSIFHK